MCDTPRALVARLAVHRAVAVTAAAADDRVLLAAGVVVLRGEHREVQVVLDVVRRGGQVARDLGGTAHHRPRDRRRWTAVRGLRQGLRGR